MAKTKKVVEEDAVVKEEKPKVEKEKVEDTVKPKQTDEKREEEKNFTDKVKDAFKDTDEKKFSKEDVENGKAMAVLSYIGILCLIPWFVEKNNKYVRFHALQGLNLCHLQLIAMIAGSIIGGILIIVGGWLISIAVEAICVAFSVVGIVYACQGKAKELPIVNKFKIVKEKR